MMDPVGAIITLLFAVGVYWVFRSIVERTPPIVLQQNERLLAQAWAQVRAGNPFSSSLGKIYLTDRRLFFSPSLIPLGPVREAVSIDLAGAIWSLHRPILPWYGMALELRISTGGRRLSLSVRTGLLPWQWTFKTKSWSEMIRAAQTGLTADGRA